MGACAVASHCMPGAVVRPARAHGAPCRRGAGAARGSAITESSCSGRRPLWRPCWPGPGSPLPSSVSSASHGPERDWLASAEPNLPRGLICGDCRCGWRIKRAGCFAGLSVLLSRAHQGAHLPVSLLALLSLLLGPLFIR